MFQIPKIPQKTKDVYALVTAGSPVLSNVFNSEFGHYSTISGVAIGLVTPLWASSDLSDSWNTETKLRLIQVLQEGKSPIKTLDGNLVKVKVPNDESIEIPFGSGEYYVKVPDGTGDYAMPFGYDWSLASLPNIWQKNMSNSNETISSLAKNLTALRYGTIMQQALGTGNEIIDGCTTFQSDALATISEDLLDVSQNSNDLLIQLCLEASPLVGIIPDTPEEKRQFENIGYIAESLIVDAQNFGSSVKNASNLQAESQAKLNELMDNFAQAGAIMSTLNDPCVQSVLGLIGSDSLQEITGIKNKVKDSSLWKDFASYFPT